MERYSQKPDYAKLSGLLPVVVCKPKFPYPPPSFPVTELDSDDESFDPSKEQERIKNKGGIDGHDGKNTTNDDEDPTFSFRVIGRSERVAFKINLKSDQVETEKHGSPMAKQLYEVLQHEKEKLRQERTIRIISEMKALAKKYQEIGDGDNAESICRTLTNVLSNMD